MKPDRWQQVDELFHAAAERAPGDRAAFLADACAGDDSLRREVESLLAADSAAEEMATAKLPAKVAAEMFDNPSSRLSAGQTLNQYRILSPLGAGGMGEVFLAEDSRLKRKVALKLLPSQFANDPDRVRRFEQEAHAVSALNHPNIITLFDLGRAGKDYFLATEFIDGQTLRQRLRDSGRLPVIEAIEITLQICQALAAAHETGIIHRDIKPENVMIRRDGYVKVLDFGLAKVGEHQPVSPDTSQSSLTDPGTVMGTASYMSPEQARGQRVDARTDIFSLGIVLYEMVAGRTPFEGANMFEVVAAILDREPAPLGEIPEELQLIVSRSLLKDRKERYQTVKEMLSALEELRDNLKLQAKWRQLPSAELPKTAPRDKSTGEIEVKKTDSSAKIIFGEIKRHRREVTITLMVFVAALAGLGYFIWNREPVIDSIAVLPFINANADPQTDYLADGISESIIISLAQLPNLKVMSRNSVAQFKGREADVREVGQKLSVRTVLLGRVMQQGDGLTVNLELVDARDNRQLWGQQYNRRLADVFAIQEEIARTVSEKLSLKLTSAERQQLAKRPTENLKAYQFYLQGEVFLQRRSREDLLKAIRYYELAIVEDANYALAYCGLAETYGAFVSFNLIAPQEGQRKAAEAARKAVALDDKLAQAHAILGQTYALVAPYDFVLAEQEMRRAIELSPGAASPHAILSRMFAKQGRLDVCLDEMLIAQKLDPLNPSIAANLAFIHYFKRNHKQALALLRKAYELGPAFASPTEIGIYIENRLLDETLAELEKLKRERKDEPILLFCTGMIYAAQGKRTEALQIANELEARSGTTLTHALWIAKIYATLREPEPALTWLERGLTAGAIGMLHKDEAMWDVIRNNPRFGDLLRRMGIPQ